MHLLPLQSIARNVVAMPRHVYEFPQRVKAALEDLNVLDTWESELDGDAKLIPSSVGFHAENADLLKDLDHELQTESPSAVDFDQLRPKAELLQRELPRAFAFYEHHLEDGVTDPKVSPEAAAAKQLQFMNAMEDLELLKVTNAAAISGNPHARFAAARARLPIVLHDCPVLRDRLMLAFDEHKKDILD